VERGGDLVFPPPYRARGVRNHVFLIRGDERRIETLLLHLFAEPSGGAVDIRPLGPDVMCSYVQIEAVNSTEPPHSGYSAGGPEQELAFWVLGRDLRRNRVVLVTPYMFVDAGPALAAGREVHGFPKQHGVFTVSAGERLEAVALDVLAVPRFDPALPFAPRRLLELTRLGPPGGSLRSWTSLAEALAAALASGAAAGVAVLRTVAALLAGGGLPAVFLKQFRDALQPDRACYQAIVEASFHVSGLRGMGLLGDWQLVLHDLASEPIRADLGLPPGPLRPLAATWSLYDFVLDRGTELWRAPGNH
jgi:hypothetical protein